METTKLQTIYDHLCRALTEYETAEEEGRHDEKGIDLYISIVDIANEFAEMIN